MTRILLVEDEDSIADPLSFLLEREGFKVEIAETGTKALRMFAVGEYDLILLDRMLPEISGTEVCKRIRAASGVPIIMLTAKDSEGDVIVGLEVGADDYITKPYSSAVLLARVRALLRRAEVLTETGRKTVLAVGSEVEVDVERHEVSVRGKAITMPLREFELLLFLVQNEGRVLTRSQLIDRVWGSDFFGDTKTLDVHIKRLRSRIENDPKEPSLITTVRGVGYRFG